tara:strand:+ start:11219 stop:12436 length:1218 start_codon:yes stop_codon:yes gene_type:complete
MTEENKKVVAIEEIEKELEEKANPQADAPKKNAVAPETSNIAGMAKYDDLGSPVVKPTDSNPDATKKSKKAQDQVNAKAQDGHPDATPDTEKGVTKVSTPGQKETVKAQKDHEMMNADAKTMSDTYGMGMEKKNGMKKEMMKKEMMKTQEEVEENDLIDVSADVDALIKDEDLSEEFKNKATTIFEAAVKAKITEHKEKLNVMFEKKLNEEIEVEKERLSEKVDSYLTYVVEEWMKENTIAIERGIKGEIAEDFITGLKKLFEDHYIDVPDEKYNVLEDQASKIEELEKRLNEEIQKSVELNKSNSDYKRNDIVNEVSSDLADSQKEKFNKLSEEVEYSNEEEFKSKLNTIKESYFGEKKSSSDIDDVNVQDDSQVDPAELSNTMARYTAAISKTKDIRLSKKTI